MRKLKKFSEYVKGILNEEDEDGTEPMGGEGENGEGGEGTEPVVQDEENGVTYTVKSTDKEGKLMQLLSAIKELGATQFDIVVNPGDDAEIKISWDGNADMIDDIQEEREDAAEGKGGEEE